MHFICSFRYSLASGCDKDVEFLHILMVLIVVFCFGRYMKRLIRQQSSFSATTLLGDPKVLLSTTLPLQEEICMIWFLWKKEIISLNVFLSTLISPQNHNTQFNDICNSHWYFVTEGAPFTLSKRLFCFKKICLKQHFLP